ncbi:uncharacterized protein LOC131029537 [Cryptomeria japonica]|uniref:uncharacterized protein LOC131029537 n=1 Tax=Cryptomeria japonica TaxID=3369 RepID=UPI0027DA63F1|nr:uncharacterized protein LOC131029537 [Cryptomeria japonica]
MFGFSYGEVLLLLGATVAVIGPKDFPRIARAAGRLAGKAVGYVQSARGQMETVLHQSQATQIHKELQDALAQVEAIRYEIRSVSLMNPGPMTRRFVEGSGPVLTSDNPLNNGSNTLQDTERMAHTESNSRVFEMGASSSAQLQSQAAAYALLAGSQGTEIKTVGASDDFSARQRESGHLQKIDKTVVLPVSAELTGVLTKHKDFAGSDIVLEAILEADVARHAKEFFKQPEAQSLSGSVESVQK